MNDAEFQVHGPGDSRLAAYATSPLPAWLWTADGKRILWANPAGVRMFGAADAAALAEQIFGPADRHRRQIARLASRLPANGAIRLERLQGFGAAPGGLATCGCLRFDFSNGSHGVLIAAGSIALIAPLPARAAPAPPASETPLEAASPEPASPPSAPFAQAIAAPSATNDGAPAPSGEAPAGFALFDAFDEPPAAEEPPELDLESVLETNLPHVEATPRQAPPAEETPAMETHPHDSSPAISSPAVETVADAPLPNAPRLPLRFTWRMDRDGRFMPRAGEFTRLVGPRISAFGRPWSEIAATFGLDPEGRVMQAVATRATWSGITLSWPVDGGGRLPVELSGLPFFDAARNFVGYRGFGACRDVDALARLIARRRDEPFGETAAPQETPATDSPDPISAASLLLAKIPDLVVAETSHQTDLEPPVETPKDDLKQDLKDILTETPTELLPDALKNVVPFRPPGETKSPALTPVENTAFNELARQLSARLETENGSEASPVAPIEAVFEPSAAPEAREPAGEPPEWLAPPEPPARGEARRDKALLDLLPVGILIYRLDRLLYANPAFLVQMGYPGLHALEDAGGLDALYVEPGVSSASSTSDTGKPVRISATQPADADAPPLAADARLYTISWDGDSALALIFSNTRHEAEAIAPAISEATPISEAGVFDPVDEPDVTEPSAVGHTNAEELAAILDTTADGIVMFDAEGNINSANRSAEALFGYDGEELARRNLAELFAPESRHGVFEYLASIRASDAASLLDHGREVLGRESKGGIIPLSMTMGRTRAGGPNFFAVFRDLSQARQTESELREARRLAERATAAKADVLARISHEVRTPLNAIIGFAEVMTGERFGALGNERYREYMKDIRASGERVIAIINDLLDLSRIETGKLDLAFTNQNLNEIVESCVAVMQPQANRERIIIRTSLAHTLPPVIADARALRQITLNLIGNSIHLANAGGQVIVSTALSDFGEVMLRVRDTGHGLNDNEVAAALEPFRTRAPSDQSESSGVSLSLTKALVEANRAKFQIKTGGRSGTLIEVVFPHVVARV
jgi:PAS domain S-box-containing protein